MAAQVERTTRKTIVASSRVSSTRTVERALALLSEVCTREDLLDAVWGPKWIGDNHVVDVHLSNLRRKLDKSAPNVKVIHTVRGVGFRLSNAVTDVTDVLAISPTYPLAVAI